MDPPYALRPEPQPPSWSHHRGLTSTHRWSMLLGPYGGAEMKLNVRSNCIRFGALPVLLLTIGLSDCGGGSGPSGSGSQPNFSISLSPESESIDQGQSGTVTVSVHPVNGFDQSVSVSVTGLPTGVTLNPASPFTISSSGQSVTLTVSNTATLGSSTISFDASSGALTSSAQASISVTQGPPGLPDDRTTFVRTDDTPLAVVYDSVHQQIFASALHLNCVDVISLATQQVVQCIPVSGALGLSLSTDGTKILVGTQVGVVAWIDTSSLQVVETDLIPQLPQSGTVEAGMTYVPPAQAYQAANGNVLLFSNWGYMNLYSDEFQGASAVEWNPVAGTSELRNDSGGGGVISTSTDHTKILVAGGNLTLYDSTSDTFVAAPSDTALQFATINPAGSQFAVVGGTPLVRFFNPSMQEIGSINIPSCCGPGPQIGVYSSDSSYFYLVYVAQSSGVPLLLTIDATSFQILGEAPAYSSQVAYISAPPIVGYPQGADTTGLVFEMADHGVAIADATDYRDFTNAQVVGDFIVATPAEGPINQSTTTQFTTADFSSLPDVFFSNQTGLNPILNGPGQLTATAPTMSAPGPVNVKAVQANGVMAFMPQGFTYGSVPIQYGLLAASTKGGVAANLFGYGYSIDQQDPNIQVEIGTSEASVQSKSSFPSQVYYPFPLQNLVVTVPQGSPGEQNITVTSSAGTAVSSNAFHYLQSVTDYPSTDSFLYVLYDASRNQLYLSAGDHIDVFSLTTNSFTSPITIPSVGGSRLILGLTLTPDSTRLLAANQSDMSVAIVNPDDPASGAVAVSLPLTGLPGNPGPFQIATTSTNQAFVTVTVGNALSGGSSSIYDIDLSSLQVTTVSLPVGATLDLNNDYIQGSTDGTTVVEATSNNSAGPSLSWQAASNTWQLHLVEGQFWSDVAISADGTVMAANSDPSLSGFPFPYLLDSRLNLTAQVNFPEFQSLPEGPSLQLEQTGALLYAVNPTGVDIINAQTGLLLERVLLTEQILSGPYLVLQTPSKVMAISPTGNQIFLLTTAGLTVVELDSVPLAIGSISPASGPAGTVVTIRGSGFVNKTAAAIDGIPVSVSFIDLSTLRVTIPDGLRTGPAQLKLSNPGGSRFVRDAAIVVR